MMFYMVTLMQVDIGRLKKCVCAVSTFVLVTRLLLLIQEVSYCIGPICKTYEWYQ